MAAKISAVATRAAPAVSPTTSRDGAATTSAGESSDAVQLKPFIVREDRLIEFKQRDVLTNKGKLALARQRYAHLGPMTDAALLRKLEEDFAKERREEVLELKSVLDLGGTKLSPDVQRKIQEVILPPSGFAIPFGERFREPR